MARSRSGDNDRGFTTDYFGRCALCEEPIPDGHATCKCGALIFRVNPQPQQRRFIEALFTRGADAPVRIGYGGSRGAAKSRCLRDAALIIASEVARTHPGIVIYIVRTVWGDCERNHVQEFEREHLPMMQWYGASSSVKEFAFPQDMGYPRITFGYGDTFKDLRRFTRGPNIFLMLIDQAEGFSEAELDELNTPNRWPSAGPGAAKTGYFFNPGGAGSEWLQRVFFQRKFNDRERASDYIFFQGFGWQNWDGWFANEQVTLNGELLTREQFYDLPGDIPACPTGKYDNEWLKTVPENERFKIFVTQTSEGRKMWQKPDRIRMGELFGRFDQFAGQYFNIWDRSKMVLR